MTEDVFFTASEIADLLNEPLPRVQYIINKKRIKPVRRIGIIRLFDKAQIDIVKAGLYGIQIRGER
jgi:hypothetical protein